MKKTIGVVVPYFNRHKTIERTLESIDDQSVKPDCVIIIDDGSDEYSSFILCKVVQNYEYMTILKQQNAGVSAARNAGINFLDCDFIAFLDSDDIWLPNHIQQSIGVLMSDASLVAVHSRYNVVSADKKLLQKMQSRIDGKLKSWCDERHSVKVEPSVFKISTNRARNLLRNGAGAFLTSSLVIKKGLCSACQFDAMLVHGEDVDFLNQVVRWGEIAFINQLSSEYVIHGENTINTTDKLASFDKLVAQARAMEKRLIYCESAEMKSEVCQELARRYYLVAQSLSDPDNYKLAQPWYKLSCKFKVSAPALKHCLAGLLPDWIKARLYR